MSNWHRRTQPLRLGMVVLGIVMGGVVLAPSWSISPVVLAQSVNPQKVEANRLLEQGNQQYRHSQFKEAIESWEQALKLYRELGDRQRESDALGNLGKDYNSLGQYAKAIEYHQQALTIALTIGDRKGESLALGNLGNAYTSLGQYAKAIEYYQG